MFFFCLFKVGIFSNVLVFLEVVVVLGMFDDGFCYELYMVCVFFEFESNLYFLIKWFINDNLLIMMFYGVVFYFNINIIVVL